MSHDEFIKLFSYMETWFGQVDERFDAVDSEICDVKQSIAKQTGVNQNHLHILPRQAG